MDAFSGLYDSWKNQMSQYDQLMNTRVSSAPQGGGGGEMAPTTNTYNFTSPTQGDALTGASPSTPATGGTPASTPTQTSSPSGVKSSPTTTNDSGMFGAANSTNPAYSGYTPPAATATTVGSPSTPAQPATPAPGQQQAPVAQPQPQAQPVQQQPAAQPQQQAPRTLADVNSMAEAGLPSWARGTVKGPEARALFDNAVKSLSTQFGIGQPQAQPTQTATKAATPAPTATKAPAPTIQPASQYAGIAQTAAQRVVGVRPDGTFIYF